MRQPDCGPCIALQNCVKRSRYIVLNMVLALAGVLFSGYMSAVKFMTSNCVFNEPCPMFLGYPACYFGFGLFLTMFLTTLNFLGRRCGVQAMRKVLRVVSLAGTLFAGSFVYQELLRYRTGGYQPGTLVLPTCAYGLIFFLLIFGVSLHRPRA